MTNVGRVGVLRNTGGDTPKEYIYLWQMYMFWSVCNWVIFKYLANGCVGGVQLSGFVLCNKEVIKMKLWCVTGF